MVPIVKLKGFGLVSAVYSEVRIRDGSKPRKYFVSSDTAMTAREIVKNYRNLWAIES
jgi:hypothetical protein